MLAHLVRRLALIVLGPFALVSTWLLWSTEGLVLARRVMYLGTRVTRRFERALDIDIVDRSEIPFTYDQVGHFGLWATAMLLIGLAVGADRLRPAIVGVGAVSVFSEVLQPAIAPGRGFAVGDLVANIYGVAAGVVALWALDLAAQTLRSLRHARVQR